MDWNENWPSLLFFGDVRSIFLNRSPKSCLCMLMSGQLGASMANVDDLINSLPTESHLLVYEKMQVMSEAEQESFLEEVAAAIASSPIPGGPPARPKEIARLRLSCHVPFLQALLPSVVLRLQQPRRPSARSRAGCIFMSSSQDRIFAGCA